MKISGINIILIRFPTCMSSRSRSGSTCITGRETKQKTTKQNKNKKQNKDDYPRLADAEYVGTLWSANKSDLGQRSYGVWRDKFDILQVPQCVSTAECQAYHVIPTDGSMPRRASSWARIASTTAITKCRARSCEYGETCTAEPPARSAVYFRLEPVRVAFLYVGALHGL